MMVELDSDDKLLKDDKNREAERDIVQYFTFNEAMRWGNLEELVLKEIPSQVRSYLWKSGKTFTDTNAASITKEISHTALADEENLAYAE